MILALRANSKTPYMLHFFAGFRTFWWRLVIEKIWKYTRAGISRKMGLKGQVETGIFLNFLMKQLGEKVFWIFHQNFCKKSIFNSPLKTHYHLASSIYVPITRSLTTSFRRSGMMMKIYASTTYIHTFFMFQFFHHGFHFAHRSIHNGIQLRCRRQMIFLKSPRLHWKKRYGPFAMFFAATFR